MPRAIPPVRDANVRLPEQPTVNNPGDYFSGMIQSTNAVDVAGFPNGGGFVGWFGRNVTLWQPVAQESVVFLDPTNKQYNCIEIDVVPARVTNEGFAAPGFYALNLDAAFASNIFTLYPAVVRQPAVSLYCTATELAVVTSPAGVGDMRLFDLNTNNLLFASIVSQQINVQTVGAANVNTSSDRQDSRPVLRVRGCRPFSKFNMLVWRSFPLTGVIADQPYWFDIAYRPLYNVRCWYDPEEKTLSVNT